MKRFHLALSLPLLLFALHSAGAAEPRPNLLLILADDLGYGDLGCYGGRVVPTPNLDRLAREGVRFTDGYVTCPACAPSRLGLMSGAYQERFGLTWNDDRAHHTLPEAQRLLPELLRGAGYKTGLIGKWNIVRHRDTVFDEIHDYVEWESDYFPDEKGFYVGSGVERGDGVRSSKNQVWGPVRPNDEYLTDRMARHAVEFIDRHAARPFFLYVAFNAVHSPWHARKSDQARFAHLPHEVLRLYAGMVASLDENVGRILDALRARNLERNTLVVFLSDNGPAMGGPRIEGWQPDWPQRLVVGSAGPLRGQKVEVYEGGVREPFILRWPAQIKGSREYSQPVISLDLLPTFCAAAGASIPASSVCDGTNLLPFLKGEVPGPPHQTLFWKTRIAGAARQGNWKLVFSMTNAAPELYDLASDIGESRNLALEQPGITRRLQMAWSNWNQALPPGALEAKRPPATSQTPTK